VVLIGVQGVALGLSGYPLDVLWIPGRLGNFLSSAIILSLIAGLGEEPGWRSFALPRLEIRYAPLLATVLLGFVWAMWHLPLALVDPRFAHGFPGGSPEGNALGRGGVSLLHAVVVLVFATGGVVLAAGIAVLSQR
jgi:membrane protease YdiL (CAAX protease family)